MDKKNDFKIPCIDCLCLPICRGKIDTIEKESIEFLAFIDLHYIIDNYTSQCQLLGDYLKLYTSNYAKVYVFTYAFIKGIDVNE